MSIEKESTSQSKLENQASVREQVAPPPICALTPFTLQDFPDHTACILWFAGCNMRCLYCHNPDIVLRNRPIVPIGEIFAFLQSRQKFLDGVVFSGGECTMFPGLIDLICHIKRLGFKIKLDTNGINPSVVKELIELELIDFIALDYKAPERHFERVTGRKHGFELFHETLSFLCQSGLACEIRTTVHTALLNERDIRAIIADLESCGYQGNYYIQNFVNTKTLGNLEEQERLLDFKLLPSPRNIKIIARNF